MKDTLKKALVSAGIIQIDYFTKKIGSTMKESQSSIVTKVDLDCEKRIVEIVEKQYPEHNILSEECGIIQKGSEYTWIIDPLDGTSNYAAKIPWFGVLIAILKDNHPIMAGAYLPIQDLLYFAEKGKGALLNDLPIQVSKADLKDTLFAFSTDYTEDKSYLDKGLDLYRFIIMNSRNVRTTNSLLDLTYVAEGKLGGDINLFAKIWDVAAPSLIIEEAGGIVRDLQGQELNFKIDDETPRKNFPIIATSRNRFEDFRAILR